MNSLPSNNSNLSFSIDQSPYMEATITQFPEVTIEGEGGRNASLNTRFSLCALSTLLDGRLVTGASDGSIKIWRNACCEMTLSKHSSYIRTLAVLKNGLLASGSADKTIDLWDLTYGSLKNTLSGHEGAVNALAVLLEDKLASASSDKTIRIWNTVTKECIKILRGHTDSVETVAVLSDGKLVSSSADLTLRIWNIKERLVDRNQQGSMKGIFDNFIGSNIAGNGEMILTGGYKDPTYPEGGNCPTSVIELEDRRLASGAANGAINIWNIQTKQCEKILLRRNNSHSSNTAKTWESVASLASLSMHRIVSGIVDGSIKIWNVQLGIIERTLSGHRGVVSALKVLSSPNSQDRLASVSGDNTLMIWKIQPMGLLRTSKQGSWINVVAALAGKIAVGQEDGKIGIWVEDLSTFEETLSGHTNSIKVLSVLPEERLASGSFDQTIRIWSIASRECIIILNGHKNPIWALAPLMDGRLASCSSYGSIFLWNITKGTREMTLWQKSSSHNFLVEQDKDRLVSASSYGEISQWNTKASLNPLYNRCKKSFRVSDSYNQVFAIALLQDGGLAMGCADLQTSDIKVKIVVWNLMTEKADYSLVGHTGEITSLIALPDRRLASASSKDATIRLWNLNLKNCESIFLVDCKGDFRHAPICLTLLTPKGLLISTYGNLIQLWDIGLNTSSSSASAEASCEERNDIVSIKSVYELANESGSENNDSIEEMNNLASIPSRNEIKTLLQNVQVRLNKMILSPEDQHDLAEDISQKRIAEAESAWISSNSPYAEYFSIFKGHFSAIKVAAQAIESGYIDVNISLKGKIVGWIAEAISAAFPPITVLANPIGKGLQALDKHQRKEFLRKVAFVGSTITETEKLGEEIALLFIRAYVHGEQRMDGLKAKEDCKNILIALAKREAPLSDCKAMELFKMGWGDIPYDTSYLSEIGDGSSTNDDSNNLVSNTISDANLHTHFNPEPPESLQDIYQIKGSLSELTLEIEKLKKNKLSPNADQRLSQIEQKISQLEENNGSIVGRGAQVQLTRRLGFNHQESQKINQEIGSTIHQLRDITDVVCRLKEDLDGLRQEWERGENLKKDPTRSERNIRVVVVSLVIVALGVFVAYHSVLSKKKK